MRKDSYDPSGCQGRWAHRVLVVLLSCWVTVMAAAAPVYAALPVQQLLPGQSENVQSAEPAVSFEEQLELLRKLLADPRVVRALLDSGQGIPGEDGLPPAELVSGMLQGSIERIRGRLSEIVDAATALPEEAAEAALLWEFEMGDQQILWASVYGGSFLFVGMLAEILFRWATGGIWLRVLQPVGGEAGSIWFTLTRAILSFLAVGLFAFGALGTFFTFSFVAFQWPPILELLILAFLLTVILVRSASVVSRFLLAPYVPALRLLWLDNAQARFVHAWALALACVIVVGYLMGHALKELGFFTKSLLVIELAFSGIIYAMVLGLVWALRGVIARGLKSPQESGSARLSDIIADMCPAVVMVSTCFIFTLSILAARVLSWTVLLITVFALALLAVNAVFRKLSANTDSITSQADDSPSGLDDLPKQSTAVELSKSPTNDHPGARSQGHLPFLPLIHRLVRILLVMGLLVLLAQVWEANLWFLLTQDQGVQATVIKSIVNVTVTLLLADFFWQLTKTAIDSKVKELGGSGSEGSLEGEGGGEVGEGARTLTLLPLLRISLLILVCVVSVLMVLSALGVDIGPLLAGAGIAGIAIGLGAQSLVRDVVAGIFFLLDDAFRVGEYVEIGELRGTVEAISLRSLRIRHHRGAVHTLPFGEMRAITNYSRDWIIMKLEFRVPFDTDLAKVKKLVKKVGAELQTHPEHGPNLFAPPKSQGVRRMEEFNMVVGVKFMSRPGEQWVLRRETYQRILASFEANGIGLAARNVVVQVAEGNEADSEAIRAAAEPFIAEVAPAKATSGAG